MDDEIQKFIEQYYVDDEGNYLDPGMRAYDEAEKKKAIEKKKQRDELRKEINNKYEKDPKTGEIKKKKHGGKVHKMKKGGSVKKCKRDGIAKRGRTRCKGSK